MTAPRLALAYALDLLLGDPEWLPHPVRWFGSCISAGERWLRRRVRGRESEVVGGAALTGAVIAMGWALGRPKYRTWQVTLAWTALATRSLLDEAGAVIRALEAGDLVLARHRLARIVGRDTAHLNESEIARAVIETLAESTCDGIVAPLFWLAAGGVSGGMAYKAINTLDSMIGHPEPPYRYFGRVAARLDDAANFIPARLTAIGIVAAAKIQGLDASAARLTWLRDGNRHASPNAGQSEAAIAGALGVRLGGESSYDGHPHHAPVLHAEGRPPSVRDAKAALPLVAIVSGLAFGAALVVLSVKSRREKSGLTAPCARGSLPTTGAIKRLSEPRPKEAVDARAFTETLKDRK
jgi:adenosylcobinamide-phosphate synthase